VGETQNRPFQLSFNSSLKVDFQGARVTSDGGLILPSVQQLSMTARVRAGEVSADAPREKGLSERCVLAGGEPGPFPALPGTPPAKTG
jgi:hypothetical protein